MIQYDINNVETEFKDEEICSVCRGPLHDEVLSGTMIQWSISF